MQSLYETITSGDDGCGNEDDRRFIITSYKNIVRLLQTRMIYFESVDIMFARCIVSETPT
jgi:hypothetical protein